MQLPPRTPAPVGRHPRLGLRPLGAALLTAFMAIALLASGADAQVKVGAKNHLNGKASGMIHLSTTTVFGPIIVFNFNVVNPDGSAGGAFTVQPGAVLVVTDVYVTSLGGGGIHSGDIENTAGGTRIHYQFDVANQQSQHIPLTSGIVFKDAPRVAAGSVTSSDRIELYGYLVKDK